MGLTLVPELALFCLDADYHFHPLIARNHGASHLAGLAMRAKS